MAEVRHGVDALDAAAADAPAERLAALYAVLVESSIAYEFEPFDATRR